MRDPDRFLAPRLIPSMIDLCQVRHSNKLINFKHLVEATKAFL
jgi:hypothetical protein